jgi:hypothetical protein
MTRDGPHQIPIGIPPATIVFMGSRLGLNAYQDFPPNLLAEEV